MRKNLIGVVSIVVFILSFSAHSASGLGKGSPWDVEVQRFLGDSVVYCLENATDVVVYQLDPLSKDSVEESLLGYKVLAQRSMPDSIRRELVGLLRSRKSYSFDGNRKKCPPLPGYAVTFTLRGHSLTQPDSLTVLLDFSCDVWYFCAGSTRKMEDFDTVHEQLQECIHRAMDGLAPTEQVKSVPLSDTLEGCMDRLLSSSAVDNILRSTVFRAYLLNPMVDTASGSESFRGYSVVAASDSLAVRADNPLLASLRTMRSVPCDTLVSNCTFLPDLAFRLRLPNGQLADVLIAFYCDEWRICYNERVYQASCPAVRNALLKYAQGLFPKDEYVRRLGSE